MLEIAGRRRAVLYATLVAAIIVSILPAAAASAGAPRGTSRFLYALGQVESGGRYDARNAYSGAYGKYQIMPANWPGWAKKYVGNSKAPQTPANQERVARGKVIDLHHWLDTWPNVAHWWLTGSGERNQARWSSSSKAYVAKIMKLYRATSNEEAVLPKPPPPPGGLTTRRIQETNAGIAYAGRWASARYKGYSDGRVAYSDRNGATATYTFYAKSVKWVGPLGPTRGKARVTVDGVSLGIVDLRRSSFKAQAILFSKSWAKVRNHVIRITVIGSGRPVAIDQFVITR